MSDLAETIDTPTTVVDTEPAPSANGGGTPDLTPDAKEPSLRDTIANAVKEEAAEAKEADKPEPKVEDKPAKTDDNPEAKEKVEDKPEAKSERGPDGKFAAKQTDEAKPEGDKPKDEGKHYTEPPKNFQADSRDVWRNTPRPVRRDIEAMVQTHTAEMERSREAVERYENVRQYDDIARANGRNLNESLQKLVEIEDAIARDPLHGLDMILREIGPRKADGHPYSLFEVAQHIVNQGQEGYQQHMARANQQQAPREDPRVAQTQQENFQLRQELIAAQVIAPFKAEHPRYDELSDTIARVLKSDMVDGSLSAQVRLEQAYAIAERLVPTSSQPVTEPEPATAERGSESSPAGKSIRSAPGTITDDLEPDRGGSIRDTLREQMRRAAR